MIRKGLQPQAFQVRLVKNCCLKEAFPRIQNPSPNVYGVNVARPVLQTHARRNGVTVKIRAMLVYIMLAPRVLAIFAGKEKLQLSIGG